MPDGFYRTRRSFVRIDNSARLASPAAECTATRTIAELNASIRDSRFTSLYSANSTGKIASSDHCNSTPYRLWPMDDNRVLDVPMFPVLSDVRPSSTENANDRSANNRPRLLETRRRRDSRVRGACSAARIEFVGAGVARSAATPAAAVFSGDGIAFDEMRFVRTGVNSPAFNYLTTIEPSKTNLVGLTGIEPVPPLEENSTGRLVVGNCAPDCALTSVYPRQTPSLTGRHGERPP